MLCSGPGPHTPASGILGTCDKPVSGVLCSNTVCQQAYAAAQTATPGGQVVANEATITANVQANMAIISTWLAANPNGAILTAAQTRVLAKMLYGIGLILLQEFGSTTGT